MSLSIYLFFPGNCAEAFDFYKSIFGGDFIVSTTYAEGPSDLGVGSEDMDKIMHISYTIGTSVLMGCDSAASCGDVHPAGGSFAVNYKPASRKEADRVFVKLLEGGETQMEMTETFWGSYFGMGKDRYGINWMINVDLQGN